MRNGYVWSVWFETPIVVLIPRLVRRLLSIARSLGPVQMCSAHNALRSAFGCEGRGGLRPGSYL